MQYGLSHMRYKKIKEDLNGVGKVITDSRVLVLIGIFLFGTFVARVEIVKNIYPFGLAILFSTLKKIEKEKAFFLSTGVIVGCLLEAVSLELLPSYLLSTIIIFSLNFINKKIEKKQQFIVLGFIGVIFFINFGLVINYYIAVITVILLLVISISSTFIFESVIDKIIGKNISCFFTNEEIMSICMLASVAIAGTKGIFIFSTSLSNILALFAAIFIGFVGGAANGAIFGVVLGVLIGLNSANIGIYVLVYAAMGIMSGVFRDMGRLVVGVSSGIVYCILLVSCGISNMNIIECAVGMVIFILIPKTMCIMIKEYFQVNNEFDGRSEFDSKIKGIYKDKLDDFSGILNNISDILTDFNDNDRLVMKRKSTAMVQKLADRVCSKCQLKSNCWRREMHYTYSGFEELFANIERDNGRFPEQLDRRCINKEALINNGKDIVNMSIISELKKNTISEGREVLSGQIRNMATSVDDIIEDFDSIVNLDKNLEEKIKRIFIAKNIKVKDITCLKNEDGRISIKIKSNACRGEQNCVKNFLPIINETSKRKFCVSNEGCEIDQIMKTCEISFEEMPKFHVSYYAVQKSKDGEKENGDSYRFVKGKKDKFTSIISDGMGSGPEAKRESEATVSLIERFTKAGIQECVAINTVNSVMAMKYKTQEKFATLDITSLDLYNGEAGFYKVGSNESFIKEKGGEVHVIDSKTLPIGVLDTVDIDVKKKKLKDGDMIIMVSDGILDYGDKSGKEHWVKRYLEKSSVGNPKDLAMGMLNEALRSEGFKVKDDMTVSVMKVYAIN